MGVLYSSTDAQTHNKRGLEFINLDDFQNSLCNSIV